MLKYNELRAALDEAKNEANHEIAAVIVQADTPLSARDIAKLLSDGDTSRGISAGSVAQMISVSDAKYFARQLGYDIRKDETETTTHYVNPDDPNDCVDIKRKHTTYFASKR